jgi:hypothetical protein
MALAVAAGGAILGTIIGGPGLGTQLGFAAGSLLGSFLFPPDPIINEGARLKDLTVTASTYGRPIIKGYGGNRVGGNIVWSPGLVEHRTEEEIGGKGGPSVTNVTYTYTASWRISFGAGVAQAIPRVWMDGKLKFDQTGTGVFADNGSTWFDGSAWSVAAELVANKTSASGSAIVFYSGAETQGADPAEEADLGVGNVPAYRGQICMTFVNYPLADFGNRIPRLQISATASRR